MKILFSLFAVLMALTSVTAHAAVEDSDSLTHLPFETVFVFKKAVSILPNTNQTVLYDEETGIIMYLEASTKDRVLKAGTRTVFNSAKVGAFPSEVGVPAEFDGQTMCGAVLFLNTEGGVFFQIQVISTKSCNTIPTIGELRKVFDLEFQPPDVIG